MDKEIKKDFTIFFESGYRLSETINVTEEINEIVKYEHTINGKEITGTENDIDFLLNTYYRDGEFSPEDIEKQDTFIYGRIEALAQSDRTSQFFYNDKIEKVEVESINE